MKLRSLALLLALCVGAIVLTASGVIAACLALRVGLCARDQPPLLGFPPHRTVGEGTFRFVLPSPDGARFALVPLYAEEDGQLGLIERGIATRLRSWDRLRVTLKDVAWMPDSERLLVLFHEGPEEGNDRIGVFSLADERLVRAFDLPFAVAEFEGVAVSPNGGSALVVSAWAPPEPGSNSRPGDLVLVDLRTGRVGTVFMEFAGGSPVYLDAHRAAALHYDDIGLGRVDMIDLDSGAGEFVTPAHLDVADVAGVLSDGRIVFWAYRIQVEPSPIIERDDEHAVVALVDGETKRVLELFEPGETSQVRVQPGGDRAVVLADTCSGGWFVFGFGDCDPSLSVWVLDLSSYVDDVEAEIQPGDADGAIGDPAA